MRTPLIQPKSDNMASSSSTTKKSNSNGAAAAAPALKFTPVGEIAARVDACKRTFVSGKTKNVEWRLAQIKQIKKMVEENSTSICQALATDLHRPAFEGVITECQTILAEANAILDNIYSWMKNTPVTTPAVLLPGSSYIRHEPLGTVLIIAPWNFPIQLLLNPALAAIAAGNTIVFKPSEVSPASAALFEELVATYLDTDAFKVIQGAVPESSELLRQRFDHILYTGNDKVARIVMKAAAENLTPVTFELGGKSPTIVDSTANLDIAAARIMWGKCLNAGQVCLAPDYVLVEKSVQEKLISKMKSTLVSFYGENPETSSDFGRIVSKPHFQRIKKLLEGCGGKIECGGKTDEKSLYISPTLILEPKLDSSVMQEEIFGPLLPIHAVENLDEAIRMVNSKEKPLALYIFSSSNKNIEKIMRNTSSGGAVINDCVMHNGNPHLPFGGVGISGMGAYHGKSGFDTFSHHRAVYHPSTLIDSGPLRFPPYSDKKLKFVSFLMSNMPELPSLPIKNLLILGLSAAVAVLSAKVAGKF